MASAFINAMDTISNSQLGENGTLELTASGVGDRRVALFFQLVRKLEATAVKEHVAAVYCEAKLAKDPVVEASAIVDLFVMAFQTRYCRGGKGEKDLFDILVLGLYNQYPRTVESLMVLVPRYGCYKDFFRLLNKMGDEEQYAPLRNRIIDLVAARLRKDRDVIDSVVDLEDSSVRTPSVSLCAKFAPREHSKIGKAAGNKRWLKDLRQKIFDPSGDHKQAYRILISRLTAALDVAEVKMCSKRFRDIEISKVPSLCMNKHRKAFLNEIVIRPAAVAAAQKGRRAAPVRTGLRHPDDEDRNLCRQHVIEATVSKSLNGKMMHPHQLVQQVRAAARTASSAELAILEVQWSAIREALVKSLEALKTKQAEGPAAGKPIDFSRLVPLVDVSGSMNGDPMNAAIALGILTSEVNSEQFRDRFITFETSPQWVNLSACTTFAEKVNKTAAASWGGSTNIGKAFDLILGVVRAHRLRQEDIPDLIIFSDMQFDSACSGQSMTQLEQIKKMFAAAGVEISGAPYEPPRIIFWNLRAVPGGGCPAASSSENVQLLSGFSPSMLEVVLSGDSVEEEVEEEEEVVVKAEAGEAGLQTAASAKSTKSTKRKLTPYDTLRKVLDDERYDPVRLVLNRSAEKELAHYSFRVERVDKARAAAPVSATADSPLDECFVVMNITDIDDDDEWEVL